MCGMSVCAIAQRVVHKAGSLAVAKDLLVPVQTPHPSLGAAEMQAYIRTLPLPPVLCRVRAKPHILSALKKGGGETDLDPFQDVVAKS